MDTSFVWDDHFVTDLDAVDEQHHALVDLFNELSQGLFSKRSDREVVLADTYARLLAYTEHHFQEEEQLMAHYQVDERHVDGHRSMHKQFVEQVIVLWSQRTTMSDPATTLVGFLTSWLGLHILGIDQSMARQIKAIRQGCTPQAAYAQERLVHDNGTQALLKMIGKLYTALSSQNAQLALANQTLEARVAARTRDLEEANDRLQAYSRTDGLLGIANRAYFNERLEHAWAMARRCHGALGLVMIDVDCFKRYNDHYGHLQGDLCLQQVAAVIKNSALRETDLVARYGGEELVVILTDTDADGAQDVAQRMVQSVLQLQLPHAASLVAPYITISAGAASQTPASSHWSARDLVRWADEALYAAKMAGRNCAVKSACLSVHSGQHDQALAPQ